MRPESIRVGSGFLRWNFSHRAELAIPNAPCDSISRANVKCFGATGNGTTDDTAAFVSALGSNRHVYGPEGPYRVGPLRLGYGAWITGAGVKLAALVGLNSSPSEAINIRGAGMGSMVGPIHLEDLSTPTFPCNQGLREFVATAENQSISTPWSGQLR